MSDGLSPEREDEIRSQIAEAIYPTYGQEDKNRSLAIADLVMPAVQAAVAAELAAVRAELAEARQQRDAALASAKQLMRKGTAS